MPTLRRLLVVALALGVVVSVVRARTASGAAQELKLDLAEIDDVRYGLLDPEIWVGQLLVVIDAQIEDFGETPAQRESVRTALEAVIRQLIDEVELTIRRQNEDQPLGSLRQLATDFVVDFDELRDSSDAFAAIAVEELDRPENRERLKSYLRQRVRAYADSTFVRTDRTAFEAVLSRRGCASRAACRRVVAPQIASEGAAATRATVLALGLAALLLAACWPGPGRFGAIELSAALVAAFALLFGGLVTPMIDIEAEISRLDLEVAGEPITFENQVLFFQSKSILGVVDLLVRTRRPDLVLVGFGLTLFSVVFPVSKLLATLAYRRSRSLRERRPVRFFALESGKWSMADVFVVALFLAYLGFDGLTGNQLAALVTDSQFVGVETQNGTELGVGFYLFAGFCLSGLIVSSLLKRSTTIASKGTPEG